VVKFYPTGDTAHIGPLGIVNPRPHIPEPDSWEQAQRSSLGSTICCCDLNKNVFDIALCIFDEHIEITIVVENACIEQLEFRLVLFATAVLLAVNPNKRSFRIGSCSFHKASAKQMY
jgi:hypothetical protein